MDSMRSLNSSLPRSSTSRRRRRPNSDLLQAFKAAALSVTTLYKTAAAEEEAARDTHSAGYLDALDDLLSFMDEQSVGFGDGEGWQVRTWATQKHQSINNTTANTGEHEGSPSEEEDKRSRSISPIVQHKQPPQYQSTSVQTEPMASDRSSEPDQQKQHQPGTFQFRSSSTLPTQHDTSMSPNISPSPPSLRLEVLPRQSRTPSHRSCHHSRTTDRMPAISFGPLGHGAGSKRKMPYHEFFDIGDLSSGREGRGSGKRGRFS